jgi:hypothetical protein
VIKSYGDSYLGNGDYGDYDYNRQWAQIRPTAFEIQSTSTHTGRIMIKSAAAAAAEMQCRLDFLFAVQCKRGVLCSRSAVHFGERKTSLTFQFIDPFPVYATGNSLLYMILHNLFIIHKNIFISTLSLHTFYIRIKIL